MRDAILAGTFVGNRDAALADAVAGFLAGEAGEAIDVLVRRRTRRPPADRSAGVARCARPRHRRDRRACCASRWTPILHHPRLRKLEGTWRGVAWLADQVDTSNRLKIKMLNVGWPEICRDLERAIEFDQSLLFRKVYEEEFGTPGGEPYGLLVVDHDVRHRATAESRTDDVTALGLLSGVAAAAFSPVIVGASPALLEVDGFADLATTIDLAAPLRNAEHARWRSLSSRADMRFVGVALPRVLARPPWQDDGTRADGFRYAEYAPTRRRTRLDERRLCVRLGGRAGVRAIRLAGATCAAWRPIASVAAWSPSCRWSRSAPIPTMSGCAIRSRSCSPIARNARCSTPD